MFWSLRALVIGSEAKFTLLFDGGCPFCQREVAFLLSRDRLNSIEFVDIDSTGYKPELFSGISYREAMGRIHAINSYGEILTGVSVFREAYRLVGLGWIYAPTTWPLIGPLVDHVYGLWAQFRLPFTGRPSLDQLCKFRE